MEEGTDYTYKNGVMTLKVNSANKEGLNSYGSYIFVETDNCRGMILLEDDGALTLSYNAETEEHNIPDCTLAAVNSGVTVMGLKGETPENVTLNFESVSYSESDEHYTYEDGVLTITDENWVGKRVRVNGTNLGNAWIIVTSGDNSSAGGRDDDTAEAITVEMNTDDYSEWSTYAPKVVPGYKITLECEKEINDLSVKYLESIDWDEDDNERWTFIDLIKDTDYTYDEETHTLTFLSSDTVNGVVDGTIGEYHEIGVSTKVEDGEGNEISYRVLFKLVTPEIFSVARYETEWSKGTGNGTLNIEFIDGDVDKYYVNYLLTYTVDSGDDEIITLTPNVTLYDKSNNVVDAECDAFSSLQDYYIGATDGYIVEEVGDVHYLVKDGVSDDYENQYIVKSEADKLYIRTTKVNDTFKMLFNYTVEMNGTTVGEYADYQNMLVLNPAN